MGRLCSDLGPIKSRYKAFMPVHIEKSGDLVGCYHSGTDRRTDNDNEQGKIELLSQCNGPCTAEMSKWAPREIAYFFNETMRGYAGQYRPNLVAVS